MTDSVPAEPAWPCQPLLPRRYARSRCDSHLADDSTALIAFLTQRLAKPVLVEVVDMVRELDLKKVPSIAESIDWARTLVLMGADDIDEKVFRESLSIIIKHRTDLDLVAEKVVPRLGRERNGNGNGGNGAGPSPGS